MNIMPFEAGLSPHDSRIYMYGTLCSKPTVVYLSLMRESGMPELILRPRLI